MSKVLISEKKYEYYEINPNKVALGFIDKEGKFRFVFYSMLCAKSCFQEGFWERIER